MNEKAAGINQHEVLEKAREMMRFMQDACREEQRSITDRTDRESWWTFLDYADGQITALCRDHATSEQFHSEFKTDLDLERLPSGKFDTNTLVMVLATFVYNVLRWVGLAGLIGEHSPVRHSAKRRRVCTVTQALICLAGKFYEFSWFRTKYLTATDSGERFRPLAVDSPRLCRSCVEPDVVDDLLRISQTRRRSSCGIGNQHPVIAEPACCGEAEFSAFHCRGSISPATVLARSFPRSHTMK